jgi:hypothetical protein
MSTWVHSGYVSLRNDNIVAMSGIEVSNQCLQGLSISLQYTPGDGLLAGLS